LDWLRSLLHERHPQHLREHALVAAALVPAAGLFEPVAKVALSPPRGDSLDDARPSALFALGRLLHSHPNDAGFSGLVEATWEDEIFSSDRTPFIAALFGHLATARRIGERIAARGATPALVFALGLVGLERSLPLILEAAIALPRDALVAMHMITGKLPSHMGQDRDDGMGVVLDDGLARGLCEQAQPVSLQRLHLGLPLGSGEAASQLWLSSALGGAAVDLPFWLQKSPPPVAPGFFELAPASTPWLV